MCQVELLYKNYSDPCQVYNILIYTSSGFTSTKGVLIEIEREGTLRKESGLCKEPLLELPPEFEVFFRY